MNGAGAHRPAPPTTAVRERPESVATARDLERRGRPFEAIEHLVAANRQTPHPEIERQLVRIRHRAHAAVVGPDEPPRFPEADPAHAATRPGDGLPAVSPHALTAEVLRAGILTRGCLLVRGLVPTGRVERLVDTIDRAFDAAEAHARGTPASATTPWFEPFRPGDDFADERASLGRKRKFVRDGGGVWSADSPRGLFQLLDALDAVGLTRVITDYLGEPPLLSVNKCTLRRVGLDTSTDWHQDGAFLGPDIRTVNVWLALSACGRDAPGLDLVPSRLDRVVETGTDGAWFDWAVGPDAVARHARTAGTAVLRPEFEPGDVLLFDQLFLHRTAIDDAMTRPRYAIETWFFGRSTYPGTQVPLVP